MTKDSGSSKPHRVSSGGSRLSAARRAIRRLKMKIKRFERYAAESRKGHPTGSRKKGRAWKSGRDGWDIEGMMSELSRQEQLLKPKQTV